LTFINKNSVLISYFLCAYYIVLHLIVLIILGERKKNMNLLTT
jgi:hypothetical protein